MEQKVCDERHKAVDDKFNRHEKWLGEHEVKIDSLTKSDTKNSTNIDNLCKQLGSQTNAIWGLVIVILTSLAGFFIWYIQNLKR